MKIKQTGYIVCGFLAGIIYVSCGGAAGVTGAVADTLGNAIDVIFANEDSGLSSTTVQGALDELDGKIDTIETSNSNLTKTGDDLATLLVGTWTGSEYYCGSSGDSGTGNSVTVTFNADSSCSCSPDEGQSCLLCGGGLTTWSALHRSLLFENSDGSSSRIAIVQYVDSSKLEFVDVQCYTPYVLTKSE